MRPMTRVAVVLSCLLGSCLLVTVGASMGLAQPAEAATEDTTATGEPTAESSPSPSSTAEPTAEPSPSPSPTAEPTAEPSPSPSPTAEPSPSPSPTAEPSPSPSPTAEPTPTTTPSPATAPSPSPAPSPGATPSPTPTSDERDQDGPSQQVYEPPTSRSSGVVVTLDEELGEVPDERTVPERADVDPLANDTLRPEALGPVVPRTARGVGDELEADAARGSVTERLPLDVLAGILGVVGLAGALSTSWVVRRRWFD